MLGSRKALWAVGGVAALAGALLAPAEAAPRVIVDGKVIRGAQVYWVGGRAMVPVRGVVQRIKGTRVSYDPAHKRVIIARGKQSIRLNLYSGYARVGGRAIPLDVPVVMRDGQALMPLRFVSEALGAGVNREPGGQTVSIRSGRPGIRVASYRSSSVSAAHPGRVAIGGIVILTLPTPGGYPDLEQRAGAVTERLNEATPGMSKGGRFNTRGFWIGAAGGDPVILGGGVPILRVTVEDARQSGKTQQQLAQEWLARMRAGMRRVYGQG